MKFILPVGCGDNGRLIIARGRMIMGNEYRKWKVSAQQLIIMTKQTKELIKPSYEDQRVVKIKCYLPDRRRDASNFCKCVLDALTGMVFDDDKWLLPQFEKTVIDHDNPRIEVEI